MISLGTGESVVIWAACDIGNAKTVSTFEWLVVRTAVFGIAVFLIGNAETIRAAESQMRRAGL